MFRFELSALALTLVAAGASAGVQVDPPRDPGSLRAAWRYVGFKTDPTASACPQPSPKAGWTTQSLFPGTENKALARYCVYEHYGPLPLPPQIDGLARLDPDAMAVMPQGALGDALWPTVSAHFHSQAGDFELPTTGGERVRLALIDTAATRESGGENYPGTSPHGYTLLNVARRLTCAGVDEAACVAQVSSRLALGWECFDRERYDASCLNRIEGGLYGLISEMAQAIQAEVLQWSSVGPSRLVLNLSIGWDQIFGGSQALVSDMPVPVAAVHAALEDAVCRGAVVVAATGNREGGPTLEAGPILPAGWEQRAAPTFAACAAQGLTPDPADFPIPGTSAPYRPLVYAVAGVRADDGRLFNARSLSAPPLAAFADHAQVATLTGAPSAALTGSSAAALVVSAATAAAGYYRPDLKPYELVQEVYLGGRGLGRTPDFCLGGAPCPRAALDVRRVTLCATLAYACRAGGPFCPATLPACAPAVPLSFAGVDLTAFRSVATPLDLLPLTAQYAPISACRFELLHYAPGHVPLDPCPHWQFYSRSPTRATEPQPGPYPCPNCSYGRRDGLVYVEIEGDYNGELTEATLKCGEQTWSIGGPEPWQVGDAAEVENVDCPVGELMQVSFTVDGADSATSPVLIEP